ncbi:MAG: alcohol acetyltransferase [Eubacteriales bacterium]
MASILNPNRKHKRWYKMDNSAIAYISTLKKNYSNVFRITLRMKKKVDPDILQKALEIILPRFPYYTVTMRRGVFWYYLEENDRPFPPVKPDILNPCMPINLNENNGYMIRVYYYDNTMSVEFFHVLADGYGAMIFLRTLCAEYLRLLGVVIPSYPGIIEHPPEPDSTLLEDAYFKYGTSRVKMPTKDTKAYKVRGTPEPHHTLSIITAIMPLDKLLEVARSSGVTITEYLAAVFMDVLYHKQKQEWHLREKPVRITVPVSLRKYFPTETMRNFILVVSPYIDPLLGDYTFEEILLDVKNYMRYKLNPKFLRAQMTMNIKTETNPFVKPVPHFIKKMVVAYFYRRIGDKQMSGEMTNPGEFKVPKEMEEHIDRAEVLMGKPFSGGVYAGLLTFGNKATLAFTSSIAETDIEMEFLRRLVKAGIHVKIESNRI